jgi:hypothetical protein
MRYLRGIFDDWLSRAAGLIFILVAVVVIFTNFSDLPQQHPLFGVLVFLMIPILFVIGGIVFAVAIVKMMK